MTRRTKKDLRELQNVNGHLGMLSGGRITRFRDHGWVDGDGNLTETGEKLRTVIDALTPESRLEAVLELWGVSDFVDCALEHDVQRVQELVSLSISIDALAEETVEQMDWGIGDNPAVRQITPVAPSMGTVLDCIHVHTESANWSIASTLMRELQERGYQARRCADGRTASGNSNYKFNVAFSDDETPTTTS